MATNPHRDALVQLARWAQRRYEDVTERYRAGGADHLAGVAHDMAATLGMARGWLELADGAVGGELPAGLLLASPAADAIVAVEADNAELRRLLASYRGASGVAC